MAHVRLHGVSLLVEPPGARHRSEELLDVHRLPLIAVTLGDVFGEDLVQARLVPVRPTALANTADICHCGKPIDRCVNQP